MAKGDTKTNQYLDIAANGTRADLPSDTCCETRSQTLIREVAERIITEEETRAREDAILQGEIDEIKNNPDVVDIVDTYADLQAYSTSGLTDKDIIRVIADETKGGLSSYYRWNSPNPGWNFVGVIPGGDGVKELSSADYNYPTANPDRVALWLLDNGAYTAPAGVMVAASTTSYPWYNTSDKTILVGGSDTVKGIYTFLNGKTDVVTTQVSDGTEADEYTLLKSTQVLQATGQSTTDTMSQKAITDALNALPTGGITELTSADYNYHSSGTTDDGVALWLLSPGLYYRNPSQTSGQIKIYHTTDRTYGYSGGQDMNFYLVEPSSQSGHITVHAFGNGNLYNSSPYAHLMAKVYVTTGIGTIYRVITTNSIKDSLTSTATDLPLSANQGKVLKDMIDALPTGGATELTSADYNYPTNNPDRVALWLLEPGVYVWKDGVTINASNTTLASDYRQAIIGETDPNTYKLIMTFGDGSSMTSGHRNLVRAFYVGTDGTSNGARSVLTTDQRVQTTGTSTTDVMSQNATTSMIFADPATQYKIKIGAGASASEGNDGIEIGHEASATGTNGIALGYQSTTANVVNAMALGRNAVAVARGSIALGSNSGTNILAVGTMDISTTNTADGYSSSNYRLLTGLYDGQSAHDAVTKGQLDSRVIGSLTSAPTTSTVGVVGSLLATVESGTGHLYICTDDTGGSYTWQTLV